MSCLEIAREVTENDAERHFDSEKWVLTVKSDISIDFKSKKWKMEGFREKSTYKYKEKWKSEVFVKSNAFLFWRFSSFWKSDGFPEAILELRSRFFHCRVDFYTERTSFYSFVTF